MNADPSSYYNALLAKAQAVSPDLVGELDLSLFQTLLLALIAKQKHVIVRTADDNIPRVSKLAVNILHTLFALSVVKLRLRPADKLTGDDFLRLLFLQTPVGHTFRVGSQKALNSSQGMPFRRTSSYPVAHDPVDDSLYAFGGNFGPPSPGQNDSSRHRLSILRTQTDPSPSLFQSTESHNQDVGAYLLPDALVISGLEHTTEQVQAALWTALAQSRIAIRHKPRSQVQQNNSTWPLPKHFLVIYVCPIGNGFERPPVHNSLNDKFAMSIEVNPPPENLGARVRRSSGRELEEIPKPILSLQQLTELRRLSSPTSVHITNRLDLYLSDLFSATRHHPHLDGILLTVRCRNDAEQLIRASRILYGPVPDASQGGPTFDVSLQDIQDIFTQVVQHRIRVLDGPRQEILSSLIFGAASNTGEDAEWETGRRTVQEILKEIVDTV